MTVGELIKELNKYPKKMKIDAFANVPLEWLEEVEFDFEVYDDVLTCFVERKE